MPLSTQEPQKSCMTCFKMGQMSWCVVSCFVLFAVVCFRSNYESLRCSKAVCIGALATTTWGCSTSDLLELVLRELMRGPKPKTSLYI